MPVDIRLSPVGILAGVDYRDALIAKAKQSDGRLIVAKAKIQRGGFFDTVTCLIPTPAKKN